MKEISTPSGRNWKRMVTGMIDQKAEMIAGAIGIGTVKVPKRIGKEGNLSVVIKSQKMGILFMIMAESGSCQDMVVRGLTLKGLMVGLVIGKTEAGVKL